MILFENIEGWGKMLDDFRQTDIYKKSDGKDLNEIFYNFLIQNYDIPKELIKSNKNE